MISKLKETNIPDNIAIFTGRGALPKELATGIIRKGNPPLLIGIENEHESWIKKHKHAILTWGQFGKLFKLLKQNNINGIIFAGALNRPNIKLSSLDWGGIKTIPQILAYSWGGDNTLLSGVITLFEGHNITVVAPHEVLPELLAPAGLIAGRKPSRKAHLNIAKAVEACDAIGRLDIGQAAIAVGGRVVALEGVEGTDGMLKRTSQMRKSGRLYEDGCHGVLAKMMKPHQEMRIDLPAIGPETIKSAAKAELKGIVLHANHSLILSKEETLSEANRAGMFIFGHTGGRAADE